MTTVTTIAAVWTALWNILFATKAEAAVATLACEHPDAGFVYEFHGRNSISGLLWGQDARTRSINLLHGSGAKAPVPCRAHSVLGAPGCSKVPFGGA